METVARIKTKKYGFKWIFAFARNLYAHCKQEKHPYRFLLSYLLRFTGACAFFRIRCKGYKLIFHPSSLSTSYWIDPDAKKNDEDLIRAYLTVGDVYVDLGANIGSLALAAWTRVGSQGKVFAFEPHPRTYQFLLANAALNDASITAFNQAVGDKAGEVPFSSGTADDLNYISSAGEIKVPMVTLDNALSGKTDRVDLLKIDVEGYEKFAFEGARDILAKTKCVYFESLEERCNRFGYTSPDVFRLLESLGFEILFPFAEERTIAPLPSDYVSHEYVDLIAIRDRDDFLKRTGYRLVPFPSDKRENAASG